MTNTIDRNSRPNARAPSACSATSERHRHRPGADHADRRPGVPGQAQPARPAQPGLRYGVKTVFSAAGAATRQFKRVQGLGKAPTRLKASGADYFDLTPDDDQKMIVETVSEFAEEILRPAAHDADDAAGYPADLDRQGRRTRHHRDQHPRGLRRHRRAPRRPSPTHWSPRHWPTATWAWRCRSWRPAVSHPR